MLVDDTKILIKYWLARGVQPTSDLVTTSGSGIDPDITPQDAQAEIPMVSRATGLSAATLQHLISQQTNGMQLGFLGFALRQRAAAQRGPGQAQDVRCATTAVAALVPRQRSRVAGEIESVASFERPWVRTDAVLVDGTGALVLRFLGRASVPGVSAGARVVVEGTPALERGVLVMRNPLYSFATVE